MPIYEFECLRCHKEFEELILGSSTGDLQCPSCEGKELKRLLSKAAFKSGSTFKSTASSGSCSGCHSGSCGSCGH